MRDLKYSGIQIAIGFFVAGVVLAGCAGSKDSPSSSFNMDEYMQVLERQKAEQRDFDEPTPSAPEMSAEEHERAGDLDAQHRNYPLAAMHYGKALQADPSRNSVRLKLGQIFLQQKMLDPALTQFEDLRKREPKSALAYQGIGHVYLLKGKLREAEEALTKAIALDRTSWQSHNLRGLTYDQAQRHGEAIAAYEAALALHPQDPGILNNLGLAYALNGDLDQAINAYERAIGAGSAPPKLYNNLGIAYARQQRYADALDAFKKASDEPRAYNNLGVALMGMGHTEQAAACFEKAIELNPQYYEKASDNLRQARQARTGGATQAPPSTHGAASASCP
jgi:tetratricopeptide (TPR) repeat protein